MKRLKIPFIVFFYAFLPVNGSPGENLEIDIHGYISQGFLFSNRNNYLVDTKKGTFQFNELGINFSTDLNDKLRVGIQLAARDLGDTGNDQVLIDWAFGDYRWRDWLGLRVGKIKLPLGFSNKTRDMDMLRTSILLPQGIYRESFRDATTAIKGAGCYGEVPLKALGDLSYQGMIGTTDFDKEGSTVKEIEAGDGIEVAKIDIGTVNSWAIVWEPPLEGLRIGISQGNLELKIQGTLTGDIVIPVPFPPYTLIIAGKGDPISIDASHTRFSIYSLEYIWRNLVLTAEYSRLDYTAINRIPDLEPFENETRAESFYGRASYRFSHWLQAGIYYSVFYDDRNDRDGTLTPYDPPFSAFQKDACLSLRFDIDHHWSFKLEGHLMKGTGLLFPQDNLNDMGIPEFKKNWALLAAKMTFIF
ncbi:MAG: hypothetical protein GY940_03360 [bacterium]|nr:hypothetical protein [bacterium]